MAIKKGEADKLPGRRKRAPKQVGPEKPGGRKATPGREAAPMDEGGRVEEGRGRKPPR
jgi:hypothetical protein